MNPSLKIALVYDRIYPASYGGAERWFHTLAGRLAAAGHEVTYITVDHWREQPPPDIDGVRVLPLMTSGEIYTRDRRKLGPVATFGAAVGRFLLRHGRAFDVVHSSVMAPTAAHAVVATARTSRVVPVLDWWEVWESAGWSAYLGRLGGPMMTKAERHLARSRHIPIVFSHMHAERLRRLRGIDDVLLLRGVLPPPPSSVMPLPSEPHILLVNRLIPEKQTLAILAALIAARRTLPHLRVVVVGTGPQESLLRRQVEEHGLDDAVSLPGNLEEEQLGLLMRKALCVALLSRREGYGLVVAEALRAGTPALVLSHPDSAAAELIEPGVNGLLVSSLDPAEIASAILQIQTAGQQLRDSTLAWQHRNADELSIEHSIPQLVGRYYQGLAERSRGRWRHARP